MVYTSIQKMVNHQRLRESGVIPTKRICRHRDIWTEEDEEKLKMLMHKGYTNKGIASILGRTHSAVSARIKKLNKK